MSMMSNEAEAACRRAPSAAAEAGARPDTSSRLAVPDPLEADHVDDDVVVTTRRGICRIALVASETADRFRRDGLGYDPMAWMLAPRRIFAGGAALDACLDRDACERAILVHGLGLPLDVEGDAVAELVGDDGPRRKGSGGGGTSGAPCRRPGPPSARDDRGPPLLAERLFTATVVGTEGAGTIQVFHASLARGESEVASRLAARLGAVAESAVIAEGFDPGNPLVSALVAPAIIDVLAQVAGDPGCALGAGLELNVEQRFLD